MTHTQAIARIQELEALVRQWKAQKQFQNVVQTKLVQIIILINSKIKRKNRNMKAPTSRGLPDNKCVDIR
jgi:predicted nucleic acid-binding protein